MVKNFLSKAFYPFTVTALTVFTLISASSARAACQDWLNHDMKRLHSKETIKLCEVVNDSPVLIVNTASNCGFTPQFKELEAIHKKYQDQGLTVIGVASDSFWQEEDDEKNIAEVCYVNYGVSFTMFAPVDVRGRKAHPLFKHLADQSKAPRWNFNKYLVSNNGTVLKHYGSRKLPQDEDIQQALSKSAAH